jgi:hypothetical protein
VRDTPVRMRQTRTPTGRWESLAGLLCQAETTSRSVSDVIEWVESTLPAGSNISRHQRDSISQNHYEKYGPWLFNEIVGFIRLHVLGSQFRGEYFSAEKRRNPISRSKVFTYRTHKLAPEVSIPYEASNAEILSIPISYVDNCQKELRKGRYIDSSILRTIGVHRDWRGLIGWPPPD